MEHSYINNHHIAEGYLSGKLSVDERMRFEEHFVDCAECHDRLRTIDYFRSGLRIVAAEESMRIRAHLRVTQAGALARAAMLIQRRHALLLAVVILLIALPVVTIIPEWRDARRELAQETRASSEWRRMYEDAERAARELAIEIQTRERESSLQREKLTAQLEQARKKLDSIRAPSHKTLKYQSEPAVFALSVMRGGNPDLSPPVNRVELAPSSEWMILLLELEPDSDFQSYRGAISTTEGRSIWTRNGLKPNSKNSLSLIFSSNLFKPGDYKLTLEGLTIQEGRVPIATYTFRVLTR